jgi:hypothetical protein
MLKKIFFAIVFQGSAMLFAQTGVLKVTVVDNITGDMLEAASVVVENAGIITASGITDAQGNIVFKNLSSGDYDVKAMYVGYPKNMVKGVAVKNSETTYLDVKLSSDNVIDGFVFTIYEKPLVDPNTSVKISFTAEEIKRSPLDPIALISQQGVQQDGITPSFRGARTDANVYIVDGMPVSNYNLPKSAIQQISVTLGGIPAQYGDGTGAFIEIETRSGLVRPKK